MDGYKMISESLSMDYSSYSEYLLYLIENLITNFGCLVIDEYFFAIESGFLNQLVNFLIRIDKLIIKVALNDINLIKVFTQIFCKQDDLSLNEFLPNIPKLSLIKVLKIVDNNLDDKGFEIFNKFLEQTEFLTELEISKNNISNKSLLFLSKNLNNSLRLLERLILSNNWIDSYMLDEFLKRILENLPKLTFLDLSGNFIDNDFLRKFDLNYLRKVCNKYEFNEVLIDMTRNRFDTHLKRKNFYLWKPDEEPIEKGIYTLDHFLQNLAIMKLKLKFKIDIIKHYKEVKDLEIYKKQMDISKCVKVYSRTIKGNDYKSNVKKTEIEHYIELFEFFYLVDQFFDPNLNNFNNKDTSQLLETNFKYLDNQNRKEIYNHLKNQIIQNLNSMNNYNYYSNTNLNQLQNLNSNIQMNVTDNFYSEERNNIIKKLFNKDGEDFNPNENIQDLNDFFENLRKIPIEIPFASVHKYINRVKIETLLSLKDKDIFSIKYLSEICSFFKLSFMEKIDTEFLFLKEKTELILKGINGVLNFEGNNLENKYFFHEINNFLDFFIKESDQINFRNDLIHTAKYVQFLRNNSLRTKLAKIYENILKEENLFSTHDNTSSEFDLIYKKYKSIEDFTKLRIPDDVKIKTLALHPLKLDYLNIAEVNISDLENDLKIVSIKLQEEESYGIRNIHDRIHFFMTTTSDENVEKNNKFMLHKQNMYLKTTRILLRYFNNLEIKIWKEDFLIDYLTYQIVKDLQKEVLSQSDKNAMINYFKLKSMPNLERKNNIDKSIKEVLNYKKRITSFHIDYYIIKESLIFSEDLKPEEENQFNFIAVQINDRLFETFDKNFTEDGMTITHYGQICKNVKNFVMFYLEIKEQFHNTNFKLYEMINLEILFQIYRYANRNDFTQETLIIQYVFGFFGIMSCYLQLNTTILNSFKKFLNYLITKNFCTDYCKVIHKNLLSFNQVKIGWVPSIFEIEYRLENLPLMLNVHFGINHSEEFQINYNTTISDLFELVMKDSRIFTNILEKRLYWIYVKHLSINENVAVFNEEYVLEIISFLEENYLYNLDYIMDTKENMMRPNLSSQVLINEENQTEGNLNESIINNIKKSESFIFTHIRFNIQRRLFSPQIISGEFSGLNLNEIFMLYEQMKTQFIKQEFSIDIADGDTINLCALLIELLKRNDKDYNKTASLEENIEANLHKVMPKFKKNIINNNLEDFVLQVQKTIEDNKLSIKTEKDLKENFLKILKNYEVFFANNYNINLKSLNSSNSSTVLPDKIGIMITLNFLIFLESSKFEPVLKFSYSDIIYCTHVGDMVYLAINITNQENNYSKELRLKIKSEDSRLIMEDILSYAQLYLAQNTVSSRTNCKPNLNNDLILKFKNVICDVKDYKFVYQRLPPFMNIVSQTDNKLSRTPSVRSSIMKNNPMNISKNVSKSNFGSENLRKNNSSQKFLQFRKEASHGSLVSKKTEIKLLEKNNNNNNIVDIKIEDEILNLNKKKSLLKEDLHISNITNKSNNNKSLKIENNPNKIEVTEEIQDLSKSVDLPTKINPDESVALEKTKTKLNLAFSMMPPKLMGLKKTAATTNQLIDPTEK